MKKLIAAGLVVMMSFGVTACGDKETSGKQQEQAKEQSPKQVVDAYFEAVKKADFETMKKMSESASEDQIKFESPQEEKYAKFIFSKMSVEVGEEKIDGDKATVQTKVTSIDFGQLVGKMFSEALKQALANGGQEQSKEEMDQMLEAMMKDENAPTATSDATVHLVKKDGKWVFAEKNEELAKALVGTLQDAAQQ
ncbi:hypothetical protein [Tumebacillus lipolyticus]|uniref:DUF4878 domain-containing protein n=1 Tax=Tumebacillus lipolyticus TaxID=1280370 RepID=A0ABW5A0C3_9BACL